MCRVGSVIRMAVTGREFKCQSAIQDRCDQMYRNVLLLPEELQVLKNITADGTVKYKINITFLFCNVCTNHKVICWLGQDIEIFFRNVFWILHLIRSDIITRFCAFVISGALLINRNYYCCNKSLYNGHVYCSIGLFQHIYIYENSIVSVCALTCVRACVRGLTSCLFYFIL